MNSNRCIIYLRVSTSRQSSNRSLAQQEDVCRDFSREKGFDSPRVLTDVKSGRTMDRQGFAQLLVAIRHREVDHLVVASLDRLGRGSEIHRQINEVCTQYGVNFWFALERDIDQSEMGKTLRRYREVQSLNEIEDRKHLARESLRKRFLAGRWPFPAPLGYKAAGHGLLVVVEPLGSDIKKAFELAVQGRSTADISRHLAHVRGRNGLPVSASSWGRILRNSLYCGRLQSSGLGTVKATFASIINEDLFERAQLAIGRRPETRRNADDPRLPLRRFVICDECGGPLTGSVTRGVARYRCPKGCVRFVADAIHRTFVSWMNSLEPRDQAIQTLIESCRKRAPGRHRDPESDRQRLRDQRVHAIELHRLNRITDDDLQQVMDRTAAGLAEVEISRVLAARLAEKSTEILESVSNKVLSSPGSVWESAQSGVRLHLQTAIFPEGVRLRDGEFCTTAINPAFNLLPEMTTQFRTGVHPSVPRLRKRGKLWARMGRAEREALHHKYFGRGVELGLPNSSSSEPQGAR
jgi:site-specific DNA recombinase